MRALFIILLSVSMLHAANAQHTNPVTVAEKRFAQFAADHSVKQAFIRFTDSTAVALQEGTAVNALAQWTHIPEQRGKLLWHPSYSAISGDSSIGFTTGPYEGRNAETNAVVFSGQYTTVWLRYPQEEWKFLIDFGTRYPQSQYNMQAPRAPLALTTGSGTSDPEARFLEEYRVHGAAAFQKVICPYSWFNIEGQHPVIDPAGILSAMEGLPEAPVYTPLGGRLATAGDFAYTYGAAVYSGRKENYLRIWGHTAEGWKILVQVLK